MSTDEILDAQAEFEKSRTTSVKLMESLAQKIGVRGTTRQRADRARRATGYQRPDSAGDSGESFLRFLRNPAVATLAAAAAGFLLVTAFRHSRR
jgi:hypothetical protein